MERIKVFNLLVLCLLICKCQSQSAEKYTGLNPCTSKMTCHECIQTSLCAWCMEPDFKDEPRCFQPSMPNKKTCREEYVHDPEIIISTLRTDELSKGTKKGGFAASSSGSFSGSAGMSSSGSHSQSASGSEFSSNSNEIVQISPQHLQLKLRINQAYSFDVAYAQAEDYPVDLYYLMDLSKSMEDDKDKLSVLGDLLSNTMKNLTSNFRLGFGSFVDKVVMPYVSTVRKKLTNPCYNATCVAPYGYKNHMPLNVDSRLFIDEVRNANVSGNLDAPEGGFDAIMQAIVCRKEIGWREKARRLLVFSTDDGFHYAGDGKLGGIVRPNDGQCHLNHKGEYTYSEYQDYPSISQLNVKVKENAINIIFAVTASQRIIYEQLKDLIEGSTAGTLSNDSSNVVKLIQEEYGKITSSVEMRDNASSAVGIKYYTSCLSGGKKSEKNSCDKLKVGQKVVFSVEILVKSCPADPKDWKQTIQIYPVGINESLILDLEMLCDCPCEKPTHSTYKQKSEKCNGHGTLNCGVCTCDHQYFGESCECSFDMSLSETNNDTKGCRPDNTTLIDCSGHGTCTCGQCKCNTRHDNNKFTGKYCQCDDYSCERRNGLYCSGHGKCDCGICKCDPGWGGKACDCTKSEKSCIPPGGGDVCSKNGNCVCGQCSCNASQGYSGTYCDKCDGCYGRCMEFKECVQCQAYKTGPLMEDNLCSNCTFVPTSAAEIKADDDKNEQLCSYHDEEKCRFTYVYGYDENDKIYIRAGEKRQCPPQVFILGVVLGVIAAIVLIGLAILLLWKMVTTIHDRREFARFEKERTNAKWDTGENPIYKQATSTFKNPTYAGR